MLRQATSADLTRLMEIRENAGPDALSDVGLVAVDSLSRLIAAGAVCAWDESGRAVGFAAADGPALHLLVDSEHRDRGIGRALLAAACARLKEAGYAAATLSLASGSSAGYHYRAAGWAVIAETVGGGVVMQKPL